MPGYGFSLTRIFPYKDSVYYRIYDSILTREKNGQRKPAIWCITHSESKRRITKRRRRRKGQLSTIAFSFCKKRECS